MHYRGTTVKHASMSESLSLFFSLFYTFFFHLLEILSMLALQLCCCPLCVPVPATAVCSSSLGLYVYDFNVSKLVLCLISSLSNMSLQVILRLVLSDFAICDVQPHVPTAMSHASAPYRVVERISYLNNL